MTLMPRPCYPPWDINKTMKMKLFWKSHPFLQMLDDTEDICPTLPKGDDVTDTNGKVVTEGEGNLNADDNAPYFTLPPRPEGMSKNAWKRLLKEQRWEKLKEERKDYMKEKAKLKRRAKAEKRKVEHDQGIVSKESLAAAKRRNFAKADPTVTIVLDCGFDDMMNDKEKVSLCSQITRCYSENRKAQVPVNMKICGFNGKTAQHFEKTMDNQHLRWKHVDITKEDLLIPESERDKYLYLSSDSDNVINSMEPGMTYIIGGIVDKGRYKNLCRNKAESIKIKTARLPIDESVKISGRRVLTTNHVFEILLSYLDLHDWKSAFEAVIPPRKQQQLDQSTDQSSASSLMNNDTII